MRLGCEGGLLRLLLGEVSLSSLWGEPAVACETLVTLYLRLPPVPSVCSAPGYSGTSQAFSMFCLPLRSNG